MNPLKILDHIGFDPIKYARSKIYKHAVESVLVTLSRNLGIPYQDLYNGLFFGLGSRARGLIMLISEVNQKDLKKIRKAFAKTTEKE